MYPKIIPFPLKKAAQQTTIERDLEDHKQREQLYLRVFSLILMISFALGSVVTGVSVIFDNLLGPSGLFGPCVIGIGVGFFGYKCSQQPQRVRLGSWCAIGYTNLLLCLAVYLNDPAVPTPGAFLITMLLSLFLLPWWGTVLSTAVSTAFTLAFYLFQLNATHSNVLAQLAKTGTTYQIMITWLFILLVPATIGIFMVRQLKQAHKVALKQNAHLLQLLNNIDGKRQFGQDVSQRISSVTTELNATAYQQTSGSQQQADALAEAVSFFQELAQTATSIALKTGNINQESAQMLGFAQYLQKASEGQKKGLEKNIDDSQQTVEINQRINDLYNQLVNALSELQEQSNQIKRVVGLMRNLSDETHLLALNAAIEAAGAGTYGTRFAIVASEVKALANRSVQASEEAGKILGDVENRVELAARVAKEGQTETSVAMELSISRAKKIRESWATLDLYTEKAGKMQQTAARMNRLTDEIALATAQQRSASSQAVETLQEIGTVAQQTASGSLQVNNTAHDLEELSRELVQTLAA